MKKIIFTVLLLSMSSAFAAEQDKKIFVVDKIANTCSSWGHSITFRFKDNSVEHNTVNITIFEWKQNVEEKKFYFSDYSTSGNMSLCQLKYDNFFCENQEGYIYLGIRIIVWKIKT